jgi:hypothetical protein
MALPPRKRKRVVLQWTESGRVASVEMDATVNENHQQSAQATTHPVEKGAAVTDHVIAQPVKLSLECIISNTPVIPSDDVYNDGATTVNVHFETGMGTLISRQFDDDFDRVRRVHEALSNLRELGVLISVITTLANYDDMVITQLSVPRSADFGNAIQFTMELKQIIIVETLEVAPLAPKQAVNRGHKATKKVDEKKEPEKKKTLAKATADWYRQKAGAPSG